MTKRKKAKSVPTRPTRGEHHPDLDSSGPSTVLALTAECLVGGAGALKESLASLLDEPRPITLDITSLQRIDTAGLQVLTAFVRERAGHGRAVEWQGAAPALTAAAHLLGLTSLLRLPA